MQRILVSCDNNLNELGKKSVDDLCKFKGIGQAKAISIEAACELGKRRTATEVLKRQQITSSIDIYKLFHPLMCDLPVEEFWILLLNQSHKVIEKIKISSGGITETSVDVRTILREALLKRATSIAMCHNHPSGNIKPSEADEQLTSRIQKAAELMNIYLVDHVIVSDGRYYSFADEGKL